MPSWLKGAVSISSPGLRTLQKALLSLPVTRIQGPIGTHPERDSPAAEERANLGAHLAPIGKMAGRHVSLLLCSKGESSKYIAGVKPAQKRFQ